jgi:hypothetical protein
MMVAMKKEYVASFAVLLVAGLGLWWMLDMQGGKPVQEPSLPPLPMSPKDATYRIEDNEITLVNGLSRESIAPDSASLLETSIVGEPYIADINNDGLDDAVVLLTQTAGGSGMFYYVAVALADGSESVYQGSNAILLGDRIAPQNIEIRDGVVVVNYAQHAEDQAFSEPPSEAVSAYLTLAGAKLMRTDVSGVGVQVLRGELVYGHESRIFTPCGGESYWIATTSRAQAALEAVYTARTTGAEPYTPVFMTVAGTVKDGLTDGFGADYAHSIDISNILVAPEEGACESVNASTSLDGTQ